MTQPTTASSTDQPSLLWALRVAAAGLVLFPAVAFAQGISPWERAAANLEKLPLYRYLGGAAANTVSCRNPTRRRGSPGGSSAV